MPASKTHNAHNLLNVDTRTRNQHNIWLVMARYIESYRISRYWRHIVSYPYRENYRSNKFDIPHYSSKSRSRQHNARIANQYWRHQQRQRRARSNWSLIPRQDSAFSRPANRRRTCEMCISARLGWGYVCLASSPMHIEGSWLLAYAIIRPNLLYYCCWITRTE